MMPRALILTTWYQIPVLALASLASAYLWPEGALAILVGGLLMGGNFWAIRVLVAKVFTAEKPKTSYAILLAGKFVLVMALIPLLLWALELDPLGFAVGLATVFAGVGLSVVHTHLVPEAS